MFDELTNEGLLESLQIDWLAFRAKYAEAERHKLLSTQQIWRRWLV